jgi:hypothetical protein
MVRCRQLLQPPKGARHCPPILPARTTPVPVPVLLIPSKNAQAIQLDEHFAYAYTLAGHEYFSIDDLDKVRFLSTEP